uniref:Uncharacterized protein n=1 Tax=Physcomitrium patens TaxID=3218 RepID=A0A2K1J1Q6_PHYPA|nr:hypothetical protein PHYPA_023358 [Physcomitrium patens]
MCLTCSMINDVVISSDSVINGVKLMQVWVRNVKHRNLRNGLKKRCLEVQTPASHLRDQQRGNNCKKIEKDIHVQSLGKVGSAESRNTAPIYAVPKVIGFSVYYNTFVRNSDKSLMQRRSDRESILRPWCFSPEK